MNQPTEPKRTAGSCFVERTRTHNWIGTKRKSNDGKINVLICGLDREDLKPDALAMSDANSDFIAQAFDTANTIDSTTPFDGAKAIENAQELLETIRGCVISEFGTMKIALDWCSSNKALTYWHTAVGILSKCRKDGGK